MQQHDETSSFKGRQREAQRVLRPFLEPYAGSDVRTITSTAFEQFQFSSQRFSHLVFVKCTFVNCRFLRCGFDRCTFRNCSFQGYTKIVMAFVSPAHTRILFQNCVFDIAPRTQTQQAHGACDIFLNTQDKFQTSPLMFTGCDFRVSVSIVTSASLIDTIQRFRAVPNTGHEIIYSLLTQPPSRYDRPNGLLAAQQIRLRYAQPEAVGLRIPTVVIRIVTHGCFRVKKLLTTTWIDAVDPSGNVQQIDMVSHSAVGEVSFVNLGDTYCTHLITEILKARNTFDPARYIDAAVQFENEEEAEKYTDDDDIDDKHNKRYLRKKSKRYVHSVFTPDTGFVNKTYSWSQQDLDAEKPFDITVFETVTAREKVTTHSLIRDLRLIPEGSFSLTDVLSVAFKLITTGGNSLPSTIYIVDTSCSVVYSKRRGTPGILELANFTKRNSQRPAEQQLRETSLHPFHKNISSSPSSSISVVSASISPASDESPSPPPLVYPPPRQMGLMESLRHVANRLKPNPTFGGGRGRELSKNNFGLLCSIISTRCGTLRGRGKRSSRRYNTRTTNRRTIRKTKTRSFV